MPVPRLRPLELIATEWNGQQVVCARDYEGLLDSPVLLPLPVVLVALLLDGRREIRDVQVEYARIAGGALLPSWDLDCIIRDLDAHGLLDSPALDARRRELAAAYRAAPYRAMAHAGASYPADPDALAAALERYLDAPPTGPAGGGADVAKGRLRGILAPHIDFRRGGPTYGRAYRALRDLPDGACVVILGVAHAGPPAPYVLTTKGYETPFGVLEVDRPLLQAVTARYPFDAFAHEPVHRSEHSVEFQALFLAYLARGRSLTILPVLCSSLDAPAGGSRAGGAADRLAGGAGRPPRRGASGRTAGRAGDSPARSARRSPRRGAGGSPAGPAGGSPSEAPEVEAFVGALRQAIAGSDRPVYVVGGVDLSHVGPRFGDAEPVGPALAAEARASDLGALDEVAAGEAEGFWQAVMAENNRRHVCGLGAIYTALRVLAPVRGRIVDYDQGVDPAGGLVGFSAVVLEADRGGVGIEPHGQEVSVDRIEVGRAAGSRPVAPGDGGNATDE